MQGKEVKIVVLLKEKFGTISSSEHISILHDVVH